MRRFVRYGLTVQSERTTWNDDRIDHLADQVSSLRVHVDDRFDAQNTRIEKLFEMQNARVEKRFDNLTYGLIYAMASILAAFGGALVAIN